MNIELKFRFVILNIDFNKLEIELKLKINYNLFNLDFNKL